MSSLSRLSPPVLIVLLAGVGILLGTGAYLATRETPIEDLPRDVAIASRGEAFDLAAHLAPGKYTIVDFYADWCVGCRVLEPKLRRLAATRADLALRKVDVVDWESNVVRQFGFTALPHMQVYDPNGLLLGEGEEAYGVIAEVFGVDVL